MRDFDRFRKRVADLFAQPENPVGAGLHVLTIHKAKGLEFDTVIVPGLGRRSKPDDKPLVLFHEWRVPGGFECLVAPIDETRAEPDELYRYLQRLDRRKSDWERTRQLYVAATRAKKRLHLMGHVGNKGEPAKGSMLSDLWPALSAEERAFFQRDDAGAAPAPATRPPDMLRRLPGSWRLPELPAPVAWQSATASLCRAARADLRVGGREPAPHRHRSPCIRAADEKRGRARTGWAGDPQSADACRRFPAGTG